MEFTDIAQECGPHKFENNMFWVTKNNGDNCVKLGNAKRTAQYFFDRVGEAHGLYEMIRSLPILIMVTSLCKREAQLKAVEP